MKERRLRGQQMIAGDCRIEFPPAGYGVLIGVDDNGFGDEKDATGRRRAPTTIPNIAAVRIERYNAIGIARFSPAPFNGHTEIIPVECGSGSSWKIAVDDINVLMSHGNSRSAVGVGGTIHIHTTS